MVSFLGNLKRLGRTLKRVKVFACNWGNEINLSSYKNTKVDRLTLLSPPPLEKRASTSVKLIALSAMMVDTRLFELSKDVDALVAREQVRSICYLWRERKYRNIERVWKSNQKWRISSVHNWKPFDISHITALSSRKTQLFQYNVMKMSSRKVQKRQR